jgi:endonuclease IV
MIPKIGVTSKVFSFNKWYRDMHHSGFKVIELNKRKSIMKLVNVWLDQRKKDIKGFDLSMHTETTGVFSNNQQFTITELDTLKSEVILCKMFCIKELVFHLKNDKLSESEAAQLREIIDFAKQQGVEMIYESNAITVADVALDFLEKFPDVNYNLDLGHLNKGYGKGMLGCEIDEFIDKVKDRVVYIHAHNNSGLHDEHAALSDGTLDWKHVLDMLDMSKVKKIIIETITLEQAKKTKEDLDAYFRSKSPS